uniref:Dystrophin-like n=1 Tax=Castor canadensis TaxID=51338 RepID=A0A8B7VPZ2_CASCN|nr:dystrophin-like [Castor canadensis]
MLLVQGPHFENHCGDESLARCEPLKQAEMNLQAEYDRLKQQHEHKGLSPLPSPPEMMPTSPQSPRDAELIAEAKLLRQHKGRLEARMQILEDHNKQLESQLHRLRQLLEQPQAEAKVNGTTVSSPSTSLQRSDSSQPMLLRVVGSQTSESMDPKVVVLDSQYYLTEPDSPVVPATLKAEAGGSLKPRNSIATWAT